jgi:hypothetical protein
MVFSGDFYAQSPIWRTLSLRLAYRYSAQKSLAVLNRYCTLFPKRKQPMQVTFAGLLLPLQGWGLIPIES